MDKAWYWKVVFVLLLMIASVLVLLPTFVPDSLPDWYKELVQNKVNLGLDLQGGIHLVLGAQVDNALEDKADQFAHSFRDAMKDKRIAFNKVFRVPGTWDIQIELKNPDDLKKLQKRVLDDYYNLEKVTTGKEDQGIARWTFKQAYIDKLRTDTRERTQVTVRNRIDELGVGMPTIARHGEDGVLVQLPGVFEPERAKKLLGRTAQLEFKLVDDKTDFIKNLKGNLPEGIRLEYYTYEGPNDEPITEYFLVARGKGNEGKNRILDFFNNVTEIDKLLADNEVDPTVRNKMVELARAGITPNEKKQILDMAQQALAGKEDVLKRLDLLLAGKVPEGREIGFKRNERGMDVEYRTYYLEQDVALTGDYITDARVSQDSQTGQYEVLLNFDRTGGNLFEKLTADNVKRRMAIFLEGEVESAPVIQGRIPNGRARITLGMTQDYNQAITEANDLATVLRAGSLPVPVRILEERTVGPSMGEDARRQGIYALVIGMILVVLFMVIYYRISGIVADFALLLNALFILAVMAMAGATLTLPGIAGIILTIGMAVDANVIINERIREELHMGKTPRASVDAGYKSAFWTIFDASFTTLIAAVVLWSYGSGPIKGFAVTLFIGIVASMFTAIFVTRLVMDWLTVRRKVERLSI